MELASARPNRVIFVPRSSARHQWISVSQAQLHKRIVSEVGSSILKYNTCIDWEYVPMLAILCQVICNPSSAPSFPIVYKRNVHEPVISFTLAFHSLPVPPGSVRASLPLHCPVRHRQPRWAAPYQLQWTQRLQDVPPSHQCCPHHVG